MILIDFSQLIISSVLTQFNPKKDTIDENLIRHVALSTIRKFKIRFSDYGKLVICCDSPNYWRKDVFPYYKSGRKKSRAAIAIDWNSIFNAIQTIKSELQEYFPYTVLEVDGCEADDIIAVLCNNYQNINSDVPKAGIMIISSDKDFIQLQKFGSHVEQYSPITKKFLSTDDPDRYLFEHICRGDSGDSVPNFLSDDDVFVVGEKRQKRVTAKILDNAYANIDNLENVWNANELRGYHRNKTLVDLSQTPKHLIEKVLEDFNKSLATTNIGGGRLLTYFAKNKLRNLMTQLQDFTENEKVAI